jgi:hypothetical protein
MADEKEPRRYKLPSELTDENRAAASRFGGSQHRPERDEYRKWRERTLRDEHDDLVLRERLLRERAELLRTQAAHTAMDALEAVTVEEHDRQLRAVSDAWHKGTERPEPPGRSTTAERWQAKAAELEAEADEIVQHLAEETTA